jgi:hypothetical protein
MRISLYVIALLVVVGVLPFGKADRQAIAREYVRQVVQKGPKSVNITHLSQAAPSSAAQTDTPTSVAGSTYSDAEPLCPSVWLASVASVLLVRLQTTVEPWHLELLRHHLSPQAP